MTPHRIIIKKVNIIAKIALLSISLLPHSSFLGIFWDFGNGVISSGMEGMALHESF
jgi:hypothetical protein